jgi:hypothetical protein
MKKEELLTHLSDYAKNINTGEADANHLKDIKNKIQDAYNAGSIDKELKGELGKKASFSFKNMFRSPTASKTIERIAEKGGTVGKFAEEAAPVFGNVAHTAEEVASKAGNKLKGFGPLLGMLGAGAMAFGAGNKAMAGDLPGAAGDVADLATDYIPGVGQAKMALGSSPLGEGSDKVVNKKPFDFTPYAEPVANPAVNDSSIAKPNPTRYADLMNQIGGAGSPDSLKEALKKKQGL